MEQYKSETNQLPRILIGIPTMSVLHANLVARLLVWAKRYDKGVVNFYFTHKVAPVDRARNQIVDYFLKTTFENGDKFDYLFFIDSDTIPPADALDKLLAMEKDIATGMTPMVQYDPDKKVWGTFFNTFWSVKDKNGKFLKTECPRQNTGMRTVDRCGGSCLLIKRSVFERMEKPYFRFIMDSEGLHHTQSEDVYFADTARSLGMEIWVDTSVVCGHAKEILL